MKLTINPKEVSRWLKPIERVIANRNTVPILDNFLFKVYNDHMDVTCGDSELFVTMAVPLVSSDGEFTFCTNAKKFTHIVGGINSETLSIEFDGNSTMTCKHHKGHFNLSYYADTENYPNIESDEEVVGTLLDLNYLTDIINNVSYAASNDTLRPALMGVYFDFTESEFVGVATDTRMLTKRVVAQGDFSSVKSFIMPTKCAKLISSFIESNDKKVSVNVGKSVVKINTDTWSIVFRPINGNFPRYNAVIPQIDNNCGATVNRDDFIDSLQRVLLFSPSQTSAIKLHFLKNKIELTAQDIDYNISSTETVECEYDGDDVSIGFNGASLLLVLNNFNGESFRFNVEKPDRPALLHPNDTSLLAIIMPMVI